MSKTMNFRAFITILITCMMASTLFGLLYCYDNKYNTNINLTQDGAVLLRMVKARMVWALKKSPGSYMGGTFTQIR